MNRSHAWLSTFGQYYPGGGMTQEQWGKKYVEHADFIWDTAKRHPSCSGNMCTLATIGVDDWLAMRRKVPFPANTIHRFERTSALNCAAPFAASSFGIRLPARLLRCTRRFRLELQRHFSLISLGFYQRLDKYVLPARH
jgi:hypothetical protein